jgi:hypothetical protein
MCYLGKTSSGFISLSGRRHSLWNIQSAAERNAGYLFAPGFGFKEEQSMKQLVVAALMLMSTFAPLGGALPAFAAQPATQPVTVSDDRGWRSFCREHRAEHRTNGRRYREHCGRDHRRDR